jgi:hypothetical protein
MDDDQNARLRYEAAELATQVISGDVAAIVEGYAKFHDERVAPGAMLSKAWTTVYGTILRELGGERHELSGVGDHIYLAGVGKRKATTSH